MENEQLPDVIYIELYIKRENAPEECWEIFKDERHSRSGFRVIRRVWDDENEFMWDSLYQFYESLDKLYAAAKSGDFEEGRKNF